MKSLKAKNIQEMYDHNKEKELMDYSKKELERTKDEYISAQLARMHTASRINMMVPQLESGNITFQFMGVPMSKELLYWEYMIVQKQYRDIVMKINYTLQELKKGGFKDKDIEELEKKYKIRPQGKNNEKATSS